MLLEAYFLRRDLKTVGLEAGQELPRGAECVNLVGLVIMVILLPSTGCKAP